MRSAYVVVSILIGLLMLTFGPVTVAADTIYVGPNPGDDFTGIEPAVDAASSGDTIIVRDGTYAGYIVIDAKTITLRSEKGPNGCIIDADGGLGIRIRNGDSYDIEVNGFTIINGVGQMGGGINSYGSSPVIKNCIIRDNEARYGGGIYVGGLGTPTIANCLIYGNTATHIIEEEDYGWGGGITAYSDSSPKIINCTIAGNTAGDEGGGVCARWDNTVTLTNCILWGNTAPNGPQIALGMAFRPSTVNVNYCDVQGGSGNVYVYPEDGSILNWGTGNITDSPLFVAGPWGLFYLSQEDAGQENDSPCVDAGNKTATSLGLHVATTRSDQVPDAGTVDMGYHYFIAGINLASPLNGSMPVAVPTFEWTSLGGIDPVYAVDIAIPPVLPLWSTYNNMHILIRDEYWGLPSALWDAIPSGARVYWRVRGADIGTPPPVIVNSNTVWSFYVYDSYPVTDESHTLTDGTPVYLDQQDVAIETVIINDVTGTITYEEGVDYNLIVEGPQVRIERIPGGAITNGQQILVDYFYYDI